MERGCRLRFYHWWCKASLLIISSPFQPTHTKSCTRYPLSHVFPLFVVLFAIFQSFLSVGPGDCNFLVSSESFPTPIRGHFLGLAAAVGKAGAAIGTTVLTQALNSFEDPVRGQQVLYLTGSAISLVGIGFVWFLIPQHNETLEEEDVKFREYLEAEGYDVSKMGVSKFL